MLRFFVQPFKLVLLALFRLHEFLHLLLFFDFLVHHCYLLVEVYLLLLSLLDEFVELVGGLVSVFVGVVGDFDYLLHLFLLCFQI